jgi:hypothetical protein
MSSISYKHPLTIISHDQLKKLLHISPTDIAVKKSLKYIIEESNKLLTTPIVVYSEICTWFSPTEKDMKSWTPQRKADSLKQKIERERLKKLYNYGGNNSFFNGVNKSYILTLAYLTQKNKLYADKALEIINSWCSKCYKFGIITENGPLEAGWGLAVMARVMELLRYNYNIPPEIQLNFRNFVKCILLPQLKYYDANGLITHFPSKGNWGTTIIEARLQTAIYFDDNSEFDFCLRNAIILYTNLFIGSKGQEVETIRDLTHTQMGLSGIIAISEIFYNQGIDIYSTNNNILLKSLEYHASILLGEPVPPELKGQFVNPQTKFASANWEIAYNHYVNIKHIEMPKTKLLLEKHRPEYTLFQAGFGTLTHYGTFLVK